MNRHDMSAEDHMPGCGTCTDFKDWMAKSKEQTKSGKKPTAVLKEQEEQQQYGECPLFRDQLGRCTWGLLHTMSVNYPKNPTREEQEKMRSFIDGLATFFPCRDCADDFQEEIKKCPPVVSDRFALSKWFCEQHNIVNRKLNKKEFDCEKVFERWKLGWSKDPRCPKVPRSHD